MPIIYAVPATLNGDVITRAQFEALQHAMKQLEVIDTCLAVCVSVSPLFHIPSVQRLGHISFCSPDTTKLLNEAILSSVCNQ